MLLRDALLNQKYSLALIWLNMGTNIASNQGWGWVCGQYASDAPPEFFTQLRPAARLQLKKHIQKSVKDTRFKEAIAIKNYPLANFWVTMGADPSYGIREALLHDTDLLICILQHGWDFETLFKMDICSSAQKPNFLKGTFTRSWFWHIIKTIPFERLLVLLYYKADLLDLTIFDTHNEASCRKDNDNTKHNRPLTVDSSTVDPSPVDPSPVDSSTVDSSIRQKEPFSDIHQITLDFITSLYGKGECLENITKMLLRDALLNQKYSLALIWLNMGTNIASNQGWGWVCGQYASDAPPEFFTQLRPAARLQLKKHIQKSVKDTRFKEAIAIKNYPLANFWVTMGADPSYGIREALLHDTDLLICILQHGWDFETLFKMDICSSAQKPNFLKGTFTRSWFWHIIKTIPFERLLVLLYYKADLLDLTIFDTHNEASCRKDNDNTKHNRPLTVKDLNKGIRQSLRIQPHTTLLRHMILSGRFVN